jgi:hypothetical protein
MAVLEAASDPLEWSPWLEAPWSPWALAKVMPQNPAEAASDTTAVSSILDGFIREMNFIIRAKLNSKKVNGQG